MTPTPQIHINPHDDCSVHEPCTAKKPSVCPLEHIRVKRAADKRGGWSQLVVKREVGGLRHYLDGKPVHCGMGLVLQHTEDRSDDYGDYSVPLQKGSSVRYEASQDGKEIEATLYIYVGGAEFVSPFQPWMRFRWPEGR